MSKRESSIMDWSPGGVAWRANLEVAYPWRYDKEEK